MMTEHEKRALAIKALEGDKLALSKLITLIEESMDNFIDIADIVWHRTLKAKVIGVTGMPGAGKSTLISRLTRLLRKQGKKVGIVAIDPSSPISGGSLLGDRIRMQYALDEGVFMRSMPAQREGALPWRALLTVEILDAVGYDYVIIETVGAGQSDVQVMNAADTVIVVLMPGAGDEIQALKAGLMEIGDIYVVNKADKPEAETTYNQVKFALENVTRDHGWKPRILLASAIMNKGVREVLEAVEEHLEFLEKTGSLVSRRRRRRILELELLVKARVEELLHKLITTSSEAKEIVDNVYQGLLDPINASKKLLGLVLKESKI